MRLTPTFVDGFLLVVNTVPDVCAIIDSHRCEMERAHFLTRVHDLDGTLLGDGSWSRDRRVHAVNWTNLQDATGSEDQVRRTILDVAAKHPGKPILFLRGFLSHFIHTDIHGVAASLAGEVENPIVVIRQGSVDDDWVDGWRQTHDALLALLPREEGTGPPLVTGFGLLRLEGDEVGNLDEVRSLWRAGGAGEPIIPFTGIPLRELGPLRADALRYAFPYAGTATGEAEQIQLPLPIGVKRTQEFLRLLAKTSGREDEVERLIERERERLRSQLMCLVSGALRGAGAVVVGDPWRVEALRDALRELGVDVPLAVVLRRGYEAEEHRAALEDGRTELIADPSIHEVVDRLERGGADGSLDVVVGAGLFADAARDAGLCSVEAAFPYAFEHFAAPNPIMGFEGVLRLAERVHNALAARTHRGRGR